ncbi:hypothetical protein [Burkholderia metallica]
MAKHDSSKVEFSKFGDTVRTIGGDVELSKRMHCQSPAEACSTQAEQLRALTVLMSGAGFQVFDCLEWTLKDNLMVLLHDLASGVANLAALSIEAEIACRTATEAQNG